MGGVGTAVQCSTIKPFQNANAKEHLIQLKLQGKFRKANVIMQIEQLPKKELANIFNFAKRAIINFYI